LAGAVEDESYNLGIEFHAEQNYSLANQAKAKRLTAVGRLQRGWRANLGTPSSRLWTSLFHGSHVGGKR